MFYLKIIVQVVIGISALVAVGLDYKWQDKRRNIFKKLRDVLITLSIFSLISGVAITVNDEKEKNEEIETLKSKLDTAQNILSSIKSSGDTLNAQIRPFIDLALRRYPKLSLQDALDSLRSNISSLDKKTSILEYHDSLRREEELDSKKLKATAPSINARLSMDSKRNIYLEIQFLNKVPINLDYSLTHSIEEEKVLSTSRSSLSEVYPPKTNEVILNKDQFNFPEHIPKNEISLIKLFVSYESIYMKQLGDLSLKKNLTKYYVVDPFKNSLVERK